MTVLPISKYQKMTKSPPVVVDHVSKVLLFSSIFINILQQGACTARTKFVCWASTHLWRAFRICFCNTEIDILQKFELYAFFSDCDCGVWLFLCSKVVKNCSRVVIDWRKVINNCHNEPIICCRVFNSCCRLMDNGNTEGSGVTKLASNSLLCLWCLALSTEIL